MMKKDYYSFVGMYFFSLFAIGSITPLIAQYLDSIGYSGFQIGIITSSATALGAIRAPLWGSFYEKKQDEKIILFIYVIASASMLLLIFIEKFFLVLLLYTFAFSLEAPIRPLNDARLLKSRFTFGGIRLWGSIGFAAGIFITSQIIRFTGFISIFIVYSLSLVVSGLFLRCIIGYDNRKIQIKDNQYEELERDNNNINLLFKNRKYGLLILSAFFINGTCIAHNTYFGFLYRDAGGTISGLGVTFLLMVLSEAPWMYFSEKLLKRFHIGQLVLIAMVISLGRFFYYSLGVSSIWLINTFFLQGIVNGLLWVLFAKYIAELVENSMLCTAVALYTAAASSVSTMLCQFLAGLVLGRFGSSEVYLMFSFFNVISILIFILAGLAKRSVHSQSDDSL